MRKSEFSTSAVMLAPKNITTNTFKAEISEQTGALKLNIYNSVHPSLGIN